MEPPGPTFGRPDDKLHAIRGRPFNCTAGPGLRDRRRSLHPGYEAALHPLSVRIADCYYHEANREQPARPREDDRMHKLLFPAAIAASCVAATAAWSQTPAPAQAPAFKNNRYFTMP